MADVLSLHTESFSSFNIEADNLAGLELVPIQKKDVFRPSLADRQNIGFFSLDRATQTEVSEIVEIKELTDNVGQLLNDASEMRRDISFAQHVMQADFESKLQQKAIEQYVRVNEKLTEMEKMQEERVATVRRAFKQQLADALARMHTLYRRDFARRMEDEKVRKDEKAGKAQQKVKEMQAALQHNQGIIEMLKDQIKDYQDREEEHEEAKVFSWSDDELESKSATVKSPHQVVMKTPSPDYAKIEEIAELKEQVLNLEDKIGQLHDSIANKEDSIHDLKNQIDSVTDQLEKEQIMVAQMKQEQDDNHMASQQDKASNQRMMENSKLNQQKEMEERLRQAREEALLEARREMEALQEAQKEKLRKLAEEKKMVEQLLTKEKASQKSSSLDQADLEHAKRNEQRLLSEITKLKREIDRVHRTWEKKFSILQQSLHALKDESFLRQTMQRQAAQLHQAAISYAYDAPAGINPTNQKQASHIVPQSKKPLPDINVKGQGVKGQGTRSPGADYISYTVSAPSGRGTGLFSMDENQVMSGDEMDLPPDLVPLPCPPDRSHSAESRPSTKSSHVVVVPSAD